MQWHLSPICCGGSALEPHGLGSQGSSVTTGSIATNNKEDLEINLLSSLMLLTLWGSLTRSKRISSVTLPAGASTKVVDHPALSIHSTKSWTGVDTFEVSTSSV